MAPVFPYHIRRSEASDSGELLLSLEDRLEAPESAKEPSPGARIPQAFRRVIEAMELPEGDGENPEGRDNDQ